MHSEIIKGYIIQFEAMEDDSAGSATDHLVSDCGWDEDDALEHLDKAFFVAKVSLLESDGKELASDYLGACIYDTTSEFYTTYRTDYFSDMVRTVFDEAGIAFSDDDARQHGLLRE